MRKLSELIPEEIRNIWRIIGLEREEMDIIYPELHISNGLKYDLSESLVIENDNSWGYQYAIHPNGAITAICKDDLSDRSDVVPVKDVLMYLYKIEIDLLGVKGWRR